MDFGITKTIPANEGRDTVENLYNGSIAHYEFHMAGKPSKLEVGHFVYTIFNDEIIGRLRITALVPGASNPKSGRPRTLIIVSCPGEKFANPITKKGHRGTRYTEAAFMAQHIQLN